MHMARNDLHTSRGAAPGAQVFSGTAGDFDAILPLMKCPVDGNALRWDRAADALVDADGKHSYPIVNGIPQLFVMPPEEGKPAGDVTDIVKSFYEETPFPNYDGLDTRDSLRRKARESVAAQLLDEQISKSAKILEVGCGTGQLSNFFGMTYGRTVVGADICMNSLGLATGFRNRFSINNAHFVQMNLFAPAFREQAFDVVVSNGVLHHTADAAAAFRSIQRLVKPGGYIIIGLYNWLGRLPTLWLRSLIARFGDGMRFLDSRMRRERDSGRAKAWFMDQYKHPHETKHSIDEVIGWFDAAGFDFVSSIPTIGDTEFTAETNLLEPQAKGSYLDRVSTEIELLISGGVDGGLYIVIGRKRGWS